MNGKLTVDGAERLHAEDFIADFPFAVFPSDLDFP